MPGLRETFSGSPHPKNVSIKVLTSILTTFNPIRPPKRILWTFRFRFSHFFPFPPRKKPKKWSNLKIVPGGSKRPTRIFFGGFLGRIYILWKFWGASCPTRFLAKCAPEQLNVTKYAIFEHFFRRVFLSGGKRCSPDKGPRRTPKDHMFPKKKVRPSYDVPLRRYSNFYVTKIAPPSVNTWSKSFKAIVQTVSV